MAVRLRRLATNGGYFHFCEYSPLEEFPQISLCQIQDFVPPAVKHRLDQENSKSLRLLKIDRRRQRKLLIRDLDAHQRRPRMVESGAKHLLKFARIVDVSTEDAASFGELGEVGIDQVCPEAMTPTAFISSSTKLSASFLVNNDFHRGLELLQAE